MKKLFNLLFIFFALLIGSCEELGSTPKKVLTEYLEAEFQFDYGKSYQYLSSGDKAIKSVDEYTKMKYLSSIPESLFVKSIRDKMSYNIQDIETQGKKATAKVEVTIPNSTEMLSEIMRVAFTYAFSEFSEEEMDKEIFDKIKDKIEKGEFSMMTEIQTFELIKEKDEWKIFFNWKTEKTIDSLKTIAMKYEEKKNFKKAIEQYEKIGKTDSSSYEAIGARDKINKLTEEFRIFEKKRKYFDKVEIRGVKLIKKELMLVKWRVIGELKNKGDKTLNKVEVTVYCLDKKGNAVSEFRRYPVLTSDLIGNRAPLRPNYSRKFEIGIEDPPSDWAGKVKIEVTDIKFSE